MFFLIVLNYATDVHASWNNFIIQHKKEVYGRGAKTWQIAPYNKNWIYFANNNGLLQFNGSNWELFPLNNGMDVRSVFPSHNRKKIYVAGINEFGYFMPDKRGKLIYTCMSDSLGELKHHISNIWNIHENDNILYFQADKKIIKYLDGKYNIIDVDCKIECSSLINGTLYIGTAKGIFMLAGNTIVPLRGASILNNKRIRGIVAYGRGILIATADRIYYWNGNEISIFLTGAESFLSKNELFSIAESRNLIAIGTVRMGLIILDKRTRQLKFYNENNGLQNNTVLSLAFDSCENLWVGLDNGIDYVCLNSSLSNLYSFPYSYGAGYAAILSGNYLYLGTNRGLYCTSYPVRFGESQPDFYQIPQSSGQVWDLVKVGGDLFCLHDKGAFLLNGKSMRKIGTVSGVWTCISFNGNPDKALLGLYDGIMLMEKVNGVWKTTRKLGNFYDSAENFEQESPTVWWVHNNDRGVVRLEINPSTFTVVRKKYYGIGKGFPSNRNIFISKMDGRIYFLTQQGIFRYNMSKDMMEVCSGMNRLLDGGKQYLGLYRFGRNIYSINENEVTISSLSYLKNRQNHYYVSIKYPSIELLRGSSKLIALDSNSVIIPNEFGFAMLNVPPVNSNKERHELRISSVYLSYPKDTLIYSDNYLGKKNIPQIPFFRNAIRFEYNYSSFTHGEDVRFRYRLNESEKWSGYSTSLVKEFSNLKEGKYIFQVEALFADGSTSFDSFAFVILPPWYRTKIAYLFYFLLLLAFAWMMHKLDDRRIKREKLQSVLEKEKEMQIKEQAFEEENSRKEQQIIHLENEKLEYELQHKSQEMVNLMINFVRKNEMLTEIKEDLTKIASTLKGGSATLSRQMLLGLNNKIDSNIQSDDVLKRIEDQFDLIHNNFMKHLSEKYPNLSANERMMCAYLKMNLSSKEIAPLLNISLRGVETIRYRLRKKFNLERDENLMDFLNNQI